MTTYYESDQSVIGRLRARRAQEAYEQSVQVQPQWVDLLNQYYDAYPQMDASVALGLAKAGIDPTSKEAQAIAQASTIKKKHEGFFDRLGDVLHPAARLVHDIEAPVAHAIAPVAHAIDETLSPVVKGGTRVAMVALETPLQLVQNYSRAYVASDLQNFKNLLQDPSPSNLVNLIRQAPQFGGSPQLQQEFNKQQTSGTLSLVDLIKGRDVDLGSGYLPSGQVEQQVKASAGAVKVKVGNVQFGGPGHQAFTVGRGVAALVTEPGTTPYNVLSGLTDAGVAWYGDPTNALGEVAKESETAAHIGRGVTALRDTGSVRQAAQALRTPLHFTPDDVVGMLPGVRNTVDTSVTDGWLTKGGRRVVDRIANEDDFYRLWQATGKKLPVDMTVRLADAKTPDEVMDILRPALGSQLDQTPEFVGFKAKRANSTGFRLAQDMPASFLDPTDPGQATETMDRWLRNAKVSPELRNAAVEKVARLTQQPGREQTVTTLSGIMSDVADELTAKARPLGAGPVDPTHARQLTRLWNRNVESARAYFTDEIAANRLKAGIKIDIGDKALSDAALELQSPFLFSEYLDSVVPMPDAREMRNATSTLARFVDNPAWKTSVAGLDAAQSAWKKMALLRGAYTVRVVGEEQVRMAASGLDSLFAHPISAISALIGGDSKIVKAISRSPLPVGTGETRQVDVLGRSFADASRQSELRDSLAKGWNGWADQTIYDKDFTYFDKGTEGYQRAWEQRIGKMSTDPVMHQIANAEGNLDSVKRWWWDGDGAGMRKRLVADHPDLATVSGSDQYIETAWEGLQNLTASDPTVLNWIAQGKVGDINEKGRWVLNPALSDHLETLNGPATVIGQRAIQMSQRSKIWDNATGFMFSHLMTKPTNYLSRGPTFRQNYWNRIEEMVPFMDGPTRARALENAAAEGGADAEQLARMHAIPASTGPTIHDLADADTIAKHYGLEQTKALLYDLTERSQFFDAMRLIFPFGEAWKEVLTRWAKIGAENPKVFRRGQQIITGARGAGFFHKDPSGEEVFTYPGSRFLTKLATGVPVDLNGRVSGLSLMTDVLPGVGPVVQMSAAALLPDTPDYDWVRQIVSPYGEQDYSNGILESFLPGYARNILQYFKKGDPRLFANTAMEVGDYLASTGDYDLSKPEDIQRWADDSKDIAKKFYLVRGMVQFGAPTAPMPQFLVNVKKGAAKQGAADVKAGKFTKGEPTDGTKMDLAIAQVVLNDYYQMQKDPDKGGVGYENAVGEFLNRYGKNALILLKGKSTSIPPVLPVTKQSAAWEAANPGLVHDYKLVWGLFAPQDDTDQFDYVEYARQFKTGDRVTLTPDQRLSMAQASVGRYIYDVAKTKVSAKPSKEERAWLAAVKQRIGVLYPGYAALAPGVVGKASHDQILAQLTKAVNDPRLSHTELAKVARAYMQARAQALAYAAEVGVKSLDAQAAAPAKEWLGRIGEALSNKYPVFQQMFDTVFSGEVSD